MVTGCIDAYSIRRSSQQNLGLKLETKKSVSDMQEMFQT